MTEVLEGSSSLEPEPLGEEVQGGVVHIHTTNFHFITFSKNCLA